MPTDNTRNTPTDKPRNTLANESEHLDRADQLAHVRERFVLDPATVYLDGNSLGALPHAVGERVARTVAHEWGELGIRSWTESGWWAAPERVGELIAPLVGADQGQVVVGDSTSVNVFKAVVGAIRIARQDSAARTELLVDEATFPTDGYIAESAARLTGCTLRQVPAAAVPGTAGPTTAAVLMNHVDYRTGELNDLPGITAAVREAGARSVWDLCHSAGALPVGLDAHGVDFAVGCTYKFLNGGPGSPAFLYLRRDLQDRFDSPLPGWHSHADPFAMAPAYEPASGATRGRVGTPEILSTVALEAALSVWEGVSIEAVRTKSLALSDHFLRCVRTYVPEASPHGAEASPHGAVSPHSAAGTPSRAGETAVSVRSLTPEEHARRGSQISLLCEPAERAGAVMEALTARGVIGDFRRPGVLRFGFTPLYTSFEDAEHAARVLGEVTGGPR
ncbi:kynureninase [Streptomyces iconiensis]|uniref:Kynureninase n=2 Tax=Streptomyces iconiensis TaxID=1384038 RepID=A0ABT7AC44_9ACTN|nr:kynureninase [Streptomyces iconiensis]MDJ1138386.1 kynureninase [Streptomyces iconiensis]